MTKAWGCADDRLWIWTLWLIHRVQLDRKSLGSLIGELKLRNKATFASMLGGMGDMGDRGGKPKRTTEKKRKSRRRLNLLKTFFGTEK